MMDPTQCRMARAALGWSTAELARRAGIGLSTVARFEAARGAPHPFTLKAMMLALEDGGVTFLAAGEAVEGGSGVRIKA